MGTLVDQDPRMAAFSGQIFPKGLDLGRCDIQKDLGTYVAEPASVIRAGQLVAQDANGYIVPSTGAVDSGPVGVAKWNKQQWGVSARVDVPIVLTGVVATFVGRANISNVTVRAAPNMGAAYTPGVGNDYVVVAAAGTIARDPLSTIPDGATVYVSFTYLLTDADFEFDGRDFRNQSNNDVLGQENRITVITDWAQLFTMEWDTGEDYSTNLAATSVLLASTEGKVTIAGGANVGAGGYVVGKCMQVPTATDQYMGIKIHGNPL